MVPRPPETSHDHAKSNSVQEDRRDQVFASNKLLARPRGATVPEIMTASGWQNHSVRAFFTVLRKKGLSLTREERTSGEQAYRLAQPAVIELVAA